MIIEAGYDLFELFAPKLFGKHGSKRRQGTWVIAMDENLRTASIPGPHEYPCSCLTCTEHQEMLQRNRERHRAAQAAES